MILVLAATAWAAVPLPSFRERVAEEAYQGLDVLLETGCAYDARVAAVGCGEGVTEEVVRRARAFRDQVFDDAGVAYLQGLAERYAGDEAAAEAAWRRAIALDETYSAPWYDLGELHLKAGRYDEAEAAFARVTALVTTGDRAWVGPWRQAEVAALQSHAELFERHIKSALERGFSFQQIVGLPNWRAFYADPALRDTLDKLLTVYATPDVRKSLQAPAAAD